MRNATHEYEFCVLVNKKPITEYSHQNQVFIEGRKGSSFELLIRNRTSRRALFIISVDGLSIIDGETCSNQSRGYVVNGHSETTIPCFKMADGKGAKFEFNALEQSYSVQIGEGDANVGVIGCRVFREQPPVNNYSVLRSLEAKTAFPNNYRSIVSSSWSSSDDGGRGIVGAATQSANNMLFGNGMTETLSASSAMPSFEEASFSDERIGVKFGKEVDFKTTEVTFKRANENVPDCEFAMFYDTKKGLERRGVIVRKEVQATPNPFPGDRGCKAPPGWKGRK